MSPTLPRISQNWRIWLEIVSSVVVPRKVLLVNKEDTANWTPYRHLNINVLSCLTDWPSHHPEWLSVDDSDVRIRGVQRIVLKLSRQEKRSLDVSLKRDSVFFQLDVTQDWNRHPQISTWMWSMHGYDTEEIILNKNTECDQYHHSTVIIFITGNMTWCNPCSYCLTCRVLFTNEAHQFHEANGDALLIKVFPLGHGGPVTCWILSLLIEQLSHLQGRHVMSHEFPYSTSPSPLLLLLPSRGGKLV